MPPVHAKPYCLAHMKAEDLKKQIDKLCRLGVLTPCSSLWTSPVLILKKPNGEYRLVCDYRRLNFATSRDIYPIGEVDQLLDTLHNAAVFSTLDQLSGYFQLPMAKDSIAKSAIITPQGTYEFNHLWCISFITDTNMDKLWTSINFLKTNISQK